MSKKTEKSSSNEGSISKSLSSFEGARSLQRKFFVDTNLFERTRSTIPASIKRLHISSENPKLFREDDLELRDPKRLLLLNFRIPESKFKPIAPTIE